MKKGFTLVELLAVIVILGIISSITVPIVVDNIEESEKSSFKIATEHLVTAIKNDQATNNFKALEYTFPLSEDSTLDVDGDTSDWIGSASITESGNISFAIYNGKYCSYKLVSANEVVVEEVDYQTCVNYLK